MLVLVVASSLILIWGAGPAMPPGGWTGLTVMDARSSILVAALALGFAALPAVVAGVGMAAWSGVATGAFTLAASLTILAWYAGPIDGLLFRSETLRHVYLDLAIEMIGWAFLWSIMLLVAGILHAGLRDKQARGHTSVPATFAALGITAILGAVVANLLAKSTDPGQVVGALVIGFAVGGWVARASVPSTRAWGLLISPLVVGLGVYLMASFNFTSDEMLQSSWFSGRMTGLALMLPIYFASAGVAGAAMGYGLGRPKHD
ncbi:hypothetical protein [Mucisphaera sp.]|uniref:hypothetical protein n=1 Tax=Mucisphaera sp. TaxID=2913024 RepID=UPI003D1430E8